jgi:hypothetical protein
MVALMAARLLAVAALLTLVLQASPAAAFSHTPPVLPHRCEVPELRGHRGGIGGVNAALRLTRRTLQSLARHFSHAPHPLLSGRLLVQVMRAPGLLMASKPKLSAFGKGLKAFERSGTVVGVLGGWLPAVSR